jgi:hypothetical protein
MRTTDPPPLLDSIPDPETIRHRLAAVVTEAALLRAQLKVSVRSAQARERLRRLVEGAPGKGGAA